jgi:hypothetical protein
MIGGPELEVAGVRAEGSTAAILEGECWALA